MRICIKNIPYTVTEDQLQSRFSNFGIVSQVEVVQNKFDPEINRGFAYCNIDFASDADQKKFFKVWNGVKWGQPQPVKVEEAIPAFQERMVVGDSGKKRKLPWSPAVETVEADQKYWKKLKDGREIRSMRIRDPIDKWKIRLYDPAKQYHRYFKDNEQSECKKQPVTVGSIVQELSQYTQQPFTFARSPVDEVLEVLNYNNLSDQENVDHQPEQSQIDLYQEVNDCKLKEQVLQFKRKIDLALVGQLVEPDVIPVEMSQCQHEEMDEDKQKMNSVLEQMFSNQEPASNTVPLHTEQTEGFLKRNQNVRVAPVVHFDPSDYGIFQRLPEEVTSPPANVVEDQDYPQEANVLKRGSYEIDLNQMQSLFRKDGESLKQEPFSLFEPDELVWLSTPNPQNDDPFAELLQCVKEERISKAEAKVVVQTKDESADGPGELAEIIARTSTNINLFFPHIDTQDEGIKVRSVYHQMQVQQPLVTVEEMSERWNTTKAFLTDNWKLRRKQALKNKRKLQRIQQ